jgi:predicted DsbA family dithiol-disulfide isomerase
MQQAVEAGRYAQVVEEAVREAQTLGVRAVPTFLLGDRFALQGAQEYTVFKQAMDRLGVSPRKA